MPTKQEKAAEEQREKVLKEGRFAAGESSDNSVDVSNEAYVGVDPEYRNHADYDGAGNTPQISEDEDQAKLEKQAKEHEDEVLAAQPGFRGYEPTTPHPSEATQPAAAAIDKNRAIVDAAAAEAAAKSDETTTSDEGSGTSEGSGTGSGISG